MSTHPIKPHTGVTPAVLQWAASCVSVPPSMVTQLGGLDCVPSPGKEPGVCPPGKQWQACAQGPASCAELSTAPPVDGGCHPGCYCPPGALLLVSGGEGVKKGGLCAGTPKQQHGAVSLQSNECVAEAECPCAVDGVLYQPGDVVPRGCHNWLVPIEGVGLDNAGPPANHSPLSPAPASPVGSPTALRRTAVMVRARPPPAPRCRDGANPSPGGTVGPLLLPLWPLVAVVGLWQ